MRRPSPEIKLIINFIQAPGDCLMLTAAIRDLHKAYPGQYITDLKSSCSALWNENPYVQAVNRTKPDVKFIEANYPEILNTKKSYLLGRYHFIHAYHLYLGKELGIDIPLTEFKGDLHFSREELALPNPYPKRKYWLINAGGKRDFTCKIWDYTRFQKVVDACQDITFIQIGRSQDLHPELTGVNVVNLLDKTNYRDLMRLTRFANGVLTGVSFPMHLAAAIEPANTYPFKHVPCIVIAGNRENRNWEQYPWHSYLCRDNLFTCASHGGCWKSRVLPLGDSNIKYNESLCEDPIALASGQTIPACLDAISADEVIELIRKYEDLR